MKKLLFTFILFLIAFNLFAQESDFGVWYGISTKTKLSNKFKLKTNTVIRSFDNASQVQQIYLENGLEYSVNDYLSFTGSYRFRQKISFDNTYKISHKLLFDVNTKVPINNFVYKNRFRFEDVFTAYNKQIYHLRLKPQLIYDTPSFPVNPYIADELFFPIFWDYPELISRNRFHLGLEYKFLKGNALNLEYIYQTDKLNTNILYLQYSISF